MLCLLYKCQVNEDDLKEFGTLSGYLCSQAGEIPAVGDYVVVGGYMFTVTKVGFLLRPCFLSALYVRQVDRSFPCKASQGKVPNCEACVCCIFVDLLRRQSPPLPES